MVDIFYGLYIYDSWVNTCIEAICMLCDPNTADRPHITVRGPYRREVHDSRKWKDYRPNHVTIYGVDNFFDDGQNTVFLACTIPQKKSVWWKPHYPSGTCHLTLYDGTSRQLAEKLWCILKQFNWRLQVPCGPMEILRSEIQIDLFTLADTRELERGLEQATGLDLSIGNVMQMSEETRLRCIKTICQVVLAPKSSTAD